MPRMEFNEEKPLRFLLEKGYVYTVRSWIVRKPHVRDVWVRRKRIGVKVKVSLAEILFFPQRLNRYVEASGFDNTQEWIEAIIRLYGKKYPQTLALKNGEPIPEGLYIIKCERAD